MSDAQSLADRREAALRAISQIDWYVACLLDRVAGRRVVNLDEAKAGYRQATSALLILAVASDEQQAPDSDCGRLLVGQGTDTWDPLCARPRGHDGPCRPGADGAPRDFQQPEEGR